MRYRVPLLAVSIAASLALCACSGGSSAPKPSPTPSSPSVTVASPSPSPARTGPLTTGPGVHPGEKPPELSHFEREHTSAGARSFAAYYFKAFDWSIATNDPYLVAEISASNCQACRRVVNEIHDLKTKAETLRGGRIRVLGLKLVTGSFRIHSDYAIEVRTTQGAEILSARSAAPSTVPAAGNDQSVVFVSWLNGGWKIVEVGAP